MRSALAAALVALTLGAPLRAAEAPAGETPEARISRLEVEERQARRDRKPVRSLEILRELVEVLDGKPRQPAFLLNLYLAERAAGNFDRAAQVRQRLIDHPRPQHGALIGLYYHDAQQRANAGDAAGARALWEQGNAVLAKLPPDDPVSRLFGQRFLSRQAGTEAILLRTEGRIEAAASSLQRALARNDADRRIWTSGPGKATAFAERDLATSEGDRATWFSELISVNLQSGRLGAAELAALEWLAAARTTDGQRPYLTSALKRYGDVLLASRRFERALATFDQVIVDLRSSGRGDLAANLIRARKSRAQTLMALGRWEESRQAFEELEAATAETMPNDGRGKSEGRGQRLGPARELLRGGTDRALVRAMVGRLAEAEKRIDASLTSLGNSYGPEHPDVVTANGMRALILAARGRDATALPLFRSYLEARTARGGSDSSAEEPAVAQLRHRLILEAYLALLTRQPNTAGALEEAFTIADALGAGRVQQAITASAARSNAGNPALAALIRDEQNLGGELAALYRALGNGESQADDADLRELRPRIQRLEKRRQDLLAELRRQFPDYDRLVRPAPPSPAAVAGELAPDEVFLSLYSAPDATYVFAVAPDGIHLHVAKLGRATAAQAIGRLRAALDVGDTPLERLPAFDIATAHDLYRQLLEPLRPAWKHARHLVIGTSGPLARIPFSLLVERPAVVADTPLPFASYADIPWLIRDRAISHVPSAAAFVTLRRHPPARVGRQPFVGFGDPDFGAPPTPSTGQFRKAPARRSDGASDGSALRTAYQALPPLPDTREEVLILAKTLHAKPEAAVLGQQASREAVLHRDLSRSAIIAFATHGLQPGELPGLDEPALAMTLVPGGDESPLLTLSDVLGLKLDADWVVLSACNTAGADAEAAEALSGLGRGFFFAGARALLVTHWPVESTSARRLVSTLFAGRGGSRADALRHAQLKLMDQREIETLSYAHPLFWAPFALVGDGGGERRP